MGVDVLIYDISYDGSVIIGDYIENNVQKKLLRLKTGFLIYLLWAEIYLMLLRFLEMARLLPVNQRLVDGGNLALFKYENGLLEILVVLAYSLEFAPFLLMAR